MAGPIGWLTLGDHGSFLHQGSPRVGFLKGLSWCRPWWRGKEGGSLDSPVLYAFLSCYLVSSIVLGFLRSIISHFLFKLSERVQGGKFCVLAV